MDVELFRRIYGASGPWLWLMCLATIVGSGWTMLPIACFAAFKKTRSDALTLTLNLVVVAIVVFSIKHAVWRTRPCNALAGVHSIVFSTPHDSSFPSGHAAGSFAFATFFALETSLSKIAKSAIFIGALAIALSRIVLGVHFPSDVLAGAFLGVVIGFVMKKVRNRTMPNRIS